MKKRKKKKRKKKKRNQKEKKKKNSLQTSFTNSTSVLVSIEVANSSPSVLDTVKLDIEVAMSWGRGGS